MFSRNKKIQPVLVVGQAPFSATFAVAVGLIIVAAAAIGAYIYGHYDAGHALLARDELDTRMLELQAENERLNAALIDAQLSRRVDTEASEALRDSMKGMRDEIAELREEVTFYKSLMAPSTLEKGLKVASFELVPMDQPGQLEWSLLITQVETRRSFVQGTVRVDVLGRRNSDEEVLSLTEISTVDAYPLKFRFRYFQDLSGVLQLPEDFRARQVVVTLESAGRGGQTVQRTFDWPGTSLIDVATTEDS